MRGILLFGLAALGIAPGARAQLRPLDPLDWSVFEAGVHGVARAGLGAYAGQRASLAGVEGRLVELGEFSAVVRLDRVAFEVSGTALRWLDESGSYAAPVSGTRPPAGARRLDAGDIRVATIVRLGGRRSEGAALRFGTRLPTTDNRVGLERDQTDFFALVGARAARGGLAVTAETGVGIHGTRDPRSEQVDVWLYSAGVLYRDGAVATGLALVGQADGLHGPSIRGNEDLRELRARLRVGRRRWLDFWIVRGLADHSPGVGVAIAAGLVF